MFQNLKFWRKKNKKITIKKSKQIPYLPLIMWFWKFSKKKDDFIKKVNFSIDNRVFRVFVKVPIGIILALFDDFSATLWGWGVKLTTARHCWEKIFLTTKFSWISFFRYKKWFLGGKYWRSLSIEKLTFLIKWLFFCWKFWKSHYQW